MYVLNISMGINTYVATCIQSRGGYRGGGGGGGGGQRGL